MINKDRFSKHNKLIELGGNFELQAKINEEIYENFDNQEGRLNDQKSGLDNLRSQFSSSERNIDIIKSDLGVKQENIDSINSKVKEFDEKIKKFNTDSLDILAEHFKSNHDSLDGSKKIWLIVACCSFVVLLVSDVLLVLMSDNPYLLASVNIISISFLYFVVAQYSSYKRLALEYKNREVVAKSYLGILNNAKDDVNKDIITKIVADTLFSRNVTDQGVELPIKEIAKISERFK